MIYVEIVRLVQAVVRIIFYFSSSYTTYVCVRPNAPVRLFVGGRVRETRRTDYTARRYGSDGNIIQRG